tara:strand:+ start:2460 stop:2828 length:369 start_codon:yes stop_codon:yes gene_type:complete
MVYNITNKDYSFVDNPSSPVSGVKILAEEYKNVIVLYGAVSVKEDESLGMATLSFNFNIQDPGEHDFDELNEDEEFKNYLGALLQYIITDTLEYNKENNLSSIGIGKDERTVTDSHIKSSSE